MPIFAEGQLNIGALIVDDVYVVVIPPQTPLIAGLPTDGIGVVGTASKGPLNTPTLVGTVADLIRVFGDIGLGVNDLVTEAIGAFKQGAQTVWCVRVSDGTETQAQGMLIDDENPAANQVLLKALSSGSGGNNMSASIAPASNNIATPNKGTVTVGGTWTPLDTATVTVDGNAVVYTVVTGDGPNSIAQSLANKINVDPVVGALVIATVIGPVITVSALTLGSGTVVSLAAASSGAGTLVAGGLSAGNLSGGTGRQTYRVTIQDGANIPEFFDNIPGIAGTTPTSIQNNNQIDPAGPAAINIVIAINNGTVGLRGPSQIVQALAGTGTGLLINQLVELAGGTDGGATTSLLLGNDGQNRTGMYALRGINLGQFFIAGMTDPTAWSLMVEFANEENSVAILGLARGISSQDATVEKGGAGIDDYHAVMIKDYLWLNDTRNNQIRLVSPMGALAGRLAALSPERSPGNKPIQGYLGTERTGYVSGSGTFKAGIPYSAAEIGLLESAGILFMTQPSVGGAYLSCRHGQNTSSNPTINGINYSRMTLFLAKSLLSAFGFAVDQVHTVELRRQVTSAISQFLDSLANPGPGREPLIGDVNGGPAFSVVCNATNNPPNTVALGYMFVSVQVVYLSIVRFFIINLEAGQSVTITVSQSPIIAAAA